MQLGDTVRFHDLLLGMDVASVAVQVMFVGEFTESARLAGWVVDAFPADDRSVAGLRVRCLGTAAVAELLQGARWTADELAREALAICGFHRIDPIEVAYAEMVLLVVGPIDDRPALEDADHESARISELGILGPLRRRVGAMVEAGCDEPFLGPREREILAALAAGGSRREVAERLHVSLNTVKTHAQRAYRSLGARSLADAVERCEALGIQMEP